MSIEFYVMSTIMGVSLLFWLYRKGKRTIAWVRKVRRAFRGICFNPNSTLNEERCRKIAVGALYAAQQGAYQNSLETGIRDVLPQILGEWWGISGTVSARKELDYLCEKGYRYYYPFLLQAFHEEDEERQEAIFQENMTSQEDYDKIIYLYQNLCETYDELIDCHVISGYDDLVRLGVTGWDAGRICFLARACYDMEYISEAEAWSYIDRAYVLAHQECASWQDLAMSYIIGRSLWGGKEAYNSVMKSTADELLSVEKSPWVCYAW